MVDMDDSFPFDPRDAIWGNPGWPRWVTGFRDHQVEAVMEVLDAYEDGADVVIVDAPTGSGKTIIAEMVRRLLGVKSALYVAHTKALQDQFMRDFGSYAKLLKGRANYPTFDNPHLFRDGFRPITAADCTKRKEELPACGKCDRASDVKVWHCNQCHPWFKCPYERAKFSAMESPLAVLNTAYFVGEANGPSRFSERELVIVDECDTLENILVGNITVEIGARKAKELGLEPPSKKTVEEAWKQWVGEVAYPTITERHSMLSALRKMKGGDLSVEDMREMTYCERMGVKLARLRVELEEGNAIYDGYKEGDIRFKPIRVHHAAKDMLWKHGQKWLLMSATVIDPREFVESLGIEEAGLDWRMVRVPSTFPPENRPIVVKKAANMVHSEKETAWPEMVEWIKEVLRIHPGERTLIHTVSYALAQKVFDGLRREGRGLFVYSKASERDEALKGYVKTPGAVLIAPSMDRGIDLPGDLCRVQIVAKVPFPNLGDKIVQRRAYGKGGELWYGVSTVRSLVQMTGRGVRSADDTCVTYILDSQFHSNIWRKNKGLLPGWWKDAVDMTGGKLPMRLGMKVGS